MALVSSTELTSEQSSKLQELIDAIPSILGKVESPEYDEIFGYRIGVDDAEHVQVAIRNEILLKFLVAFEYDVSLAQRRLAETMNWRGKFNVLSAAYVEEFDEALNRMGITTHFPENKNNFRVVSWNFYNNVKLTKSYFVGFKASTQKGTPGSDVPGSDVHGSQFLRWRIGLMERSLGLLDYTDADNTKMAQVHDYKGVSIFRVDGDMKAVTKEIIKLFSDHYPELLSKKFFVHVPRLMGWVFGFFKTLGIISASTLQRFEMLNHGDLSDLLGPDNLPADYNGGIDNRKVPTITSLAVPRLQLQVPAYARVILQKRGQLLESE